MFLQDSSKSELRQMAIEHWHRSLELNPQQPKIRELIEKYRTAAGSDVDPALSSAPAR
jgi:hypothetical protein